MALYKSREFELIKLLLLSANILSILKNRCFLPVSVSLADQCGSSSFLWELEDKEFLFVQNEVDSSVPLLMLTVHQAENLSLDV